MVQQPSPNMRKQKNLLNYVSDSERFWNKSFFFFQLLLLLINWYMCLCFYPCIFYTFFFLQWNSSLYCPSEKPLSPNQSVLLSVSLPRETRNVWITYLRKELLSSGPLRIYLVHNYQALFFFLTIFIMRKEIQQFNTNIFK